MATKNRKDIRKEKRQQKKLNRFNYHNTKKNNSKGGKGNTGNGKHSKAQNDDSEEEIPSDDEEIDSASSETEIEEEKPKLDKFEEHRAREKKVEDEYFSEIKKGRIEQLQQQNEEEDKIIAKYEKLLKLNKRKRKNGTVSSKFNDGLDYLLELCTDDSIQKMYKAAKEVSLDNPDQDEDFETDFKSVLDDAPIKKRRTLKESKKIKETASSKERSEKLKEVEKKYFGDDEDFFNNFVADSCDETDSELESNGGQKDSESDDSAPEVIEKQSRKKKGKMTVAESESEASDGMGSESEESASAEAMESDEQMSGDESDGDPEADDSEVDESEEGEPKVREDIYGRTIDKSGNVIKGDTQKYVPPSMRAVMAAEGDPERKGKLQTLKRIIKGHINRLAESNLHRITIDIENLYNSNARNDVNTVLTETITDSLISNVLAADRLVLEQTLLIAVLHANIGSEIGAFFLQKIVERFEAMFADVDKLKVENKQLDNVIFIICHLYTYRLFKHTMVYELLEKLCEKLTEKRIECILLILRSIGFLLRKDDPLMLKEFMIKAQKLALSKGEESAQNTRVMFMLDVLMAVKNNNTSKIPQFDSSLVEHFRKLLKQFVREGKYITTLAISMKDLLNADDRGKWWLVGSAWVGHEKSASSHGIEGDHKNDERRQKIFELAKKQRMNTDVKRNIFYVLLTAEDYLDAFEKILSTTKDERSIVAVIVHCSLSEKDYNPYYGVLAQKFCEHNRKFLLALQFTFWDKFKDVDSMPPKQITNLAKLIGFLVENGTLPLSVLKAIEFNQMEKATLRLLRQIMLCLLLTDQEKFQSTFERISPSNKLDSFKDQLRLFLKVFIKKDTEKAGLPDDKMLLLKNRIQQAERLLMTKRY